ncbi:baseplate J/gp47 family protein [Pseudomonas syringae]|nr:baseplate J/gp47 family protein [Pseudomonas syringae]MBD8802301.1 baseplate J/gp47 family protein [Pseudomonas syringae]MBD8812874.1 baseplate J/gp47 family protein [Pseudomonas syringae]
MIDLSQLPAPEVLEELGFEDLYQETLGNFRMAMGDNWTAALESDPVVKLLEEGAYQKLLNRARINDAAKALLLAYAQGNDLDQIGANYSLTRLIVREADNTVVPPLARIMEEDDAFRERIQLVFEGLTTAGPRNSYILHSRSASALVGDASAESPSPATVVVTVQHLSGTGAVNQALLNTVAAALNDDKVRPLGDRVVVQGAQILPYEIKATVHMQGSGPENETVLATAKANLLAKVNPRRRLGVPVARSGIDALLHIDGVAWVELAGWTDLKPNAAQAAYCTKVTVTKGVV